MFVQNLQTRFHALHFQVIGSTQQKVRKRAIKLVLLYSFTSRRNISGHYKH